MHQQRHADEGGAQAGQKQSARALAQKDPYSERDEHRGEIREQRRVRHRRQLDRGVPEREVAREGEAGRQQQRPFTRVTTCGLSRAQVENPQHGNRDGDSPEGSRGGASLGYPDEDRRERDAGRAG